MQEWKAAGGSRATSITKFFLVDDTGQKTLAVVGKEQLEDGQYIYTSEPAFEQFGALKTKVRRDMLYWLEGIIEKSMATGGVAVKEADSLQTALGSAAGFDEHDMFVRYECASSTYPETKPVAQFSSMLCFVLFPGLVVSTTIAGRTLLGSFQPNMAHACPDATHTCTMHDQYSTTAILQPDSSF